MKVLNLIIKQQYFDEIAAGIKTQEFREVKPTTVKKLIQLDEDGYEIEDENANAIPIQYDALRLYVGYNKDRDEMLIEVKDAHTEVFVNEKGEPITYTHGTDPKTGEPLEWVAEQVVYDLGKILEIKRNKKSKNLLN